MKKFTNVKKVASTIISAALVCSALCFTGCGNNSNSNELLIGATGPLTGDASSYGTSVKNGAQLAVEEINAAGGLNGITFKFDIKDDKATAEDAVTGYNSLMDAGMKISLGAVTSGSCEAFAKKAAEDNLFFITPSASAANVIADRSNAFRVCFGDPDQGVLAAQELTSKYTNIGCIYDTSDDYSSGIFKAFDDEMAKLGKTYTVKTFDKDTNKDFSTQAAALAECDVIFLPIYYTEAGLIAKACTAKGCKAVLFGCDGFDGIADQLDDTVANVIKYITPFDVASSDEAVSKFVSAYKAKYNEDPDQFAADGYDAIYAIYNTLKAANFSDVSASVSDICNLVVNTITDPSFKLVGATGTMTWDATGACTKVPQIVEFAK